MQHQKFKYCWNAVLFFCFRLKQDKPVSLLEKNDIEKFLNGILPDGSNISGSVFVVGLFADAQSKGEKGFFQTNLTYVTHTVCIIFNSMNTRATIKLFQLPIYFYLFILQGVNTYQGVAKRLGDQFTFGINTNGNGKDL